MVMQQMQQKRRITYESASIPYGKLCLRLGLTPNVLTGISFLISAGASVLYWRGELLWGAAVVCLTMFTDMLDGATARAGNCGTKFGGILDHVSDRYAEALILFGIALSGAVNPIWAMFALFGMIIASYTREAAESQGKLENVAVGAVGRLEKLLLIIVGSVVEYFYPGHNILTYALVIVGVVSYVTSVQRLIYARKLLEERDRRE
ncbi:MAG: CDP-alcohol phosphatidyltransferase family protein [candidate division Zixibacteria bacterium]|nr:CDP-alcohol phosphatidyltransferase family protein [candidate division Zixibacteria bacterium]